VSIAHIAFNWASLPKDSVCVDVGGATGSLAKLLLDAHPHLKFVVQDQKKSIEQGNKVSIDYSLLSLLLSNEMMYVDLERLQPRGSRIRPGSITR
jgi:hypothetical protein